MINDLPLLPSRNGLVKDEVEVSLFTSSTINDSENDSNSYLKAVKDDHILEFQSLDEKCGDILNKENFSDENIPELDRELIEYLIENTERDEEGRLIMPLLWNDKVKHLLPTNLNLAKNILKSMFK